MELQLCYIEVFGRWHVAEGDRDSPVLEYVAAHDAAIESSMCTPTGLKLDTFLIPLPSSKTTVRDFIISGGWIFCKPVNEADPKCFQNVLKSWPPSAATASRDWGENLPPMLPPASQRDGSVDPDSATTLQLAYGEVAKFVKPPPPFKSLKVRDALAHAWLTSHIKSWMETLGIDIEVVVRCLPDSRSELAKKCSRPRDLFIICHPADVNNDKCLWKRVKQLEEQSHSQNKKKSVETDERFTREEQSQSQNKKSVETDERFTSGEPSGVLKSQSKEAQHSETLQSNVKADHSVMQDEETILTFVSGEERAQHSETQDEETILTLVSGEERAQHSETLPNKEPLYPNVHVDVHVEDSKPKQAADETQNLSKMFARLEQMEKEQRKEREQWKRVESKLTSNYEKQNNKMKILEESVADGKDREYKLQGDVSRLRGTILELRSTIGKVQEELNSLRDEKTDLQEQVNRLKGKVQELTHNLVLSEHCKAILAKDLKPIADIFVRKLVEQFRRTMMARLKKKLTEEDYNAIPLDTQCERSDGGDNPERAWWNRQVGDHLQEFMEQLGVADSADNRNMFLQTRFSGSLQQRGGDAGHRFSEPEVFYAELVCTAKGYDHDLLQNIFRHVYGEDRDPKTLWFQNKKFCINCPLHCGG